MTVECVTLSTNDLFLGNPLASQHRLRHKSIIERQGWNVPSYNDMEYDQYDNPAATYLIWRDNQLEARGVTRLYPTDRPYMLKESFPHFISTYLPESTNILEGSRFCIDNTLDVQTRKQIAHELIIAYLEFGLDHNISHIIGLMYPVYWKSLFYQNNWKPYWLGDPQKTSEGLTARAGYVVVSSENLQMVRSATQIHNRVINYGEKYELRQSI
jgi:acyl homoserine lactone synthase